MTPIIDIHTHHATARQAIIAVDPRQFNPQPGLFYSVGYHPWAELSSLTDADYALLAQCANHPQVLAVGETGIDRLRGCDMTAQRQAFVRHVRLAASLHKPLIVHSVRATQDVLALWRTVPEAVGGTAPMIIHGMRGKPTVAQTLLSAGCYLSYGLHFNAAALAATPLDHLFIETDDAPDDGGIQAVAQQVAESLGITANHLLDIVAANAHCLFSQTGASGI